MRIQKVRPTGIERILHEDDIIVSKTDPRGIITYANDIFQQISGFSEAELLGQPHNLIRHPDMPQCVFRLLWQTIASGEEIFAYVVNQCKNGDHYWVLAHVTPTFDSKGKITGYHSNRRAPGRNAIAAMRPIYEALNAEERRSADPEAGMRAATELLVTHLKKAGMSYEQFIFSLASKEEMACQ